jgi:hypothetical protein
MNRIDHTREVPNIAGVSLALYLLVSILSMMAAYEVGKVSDDVRNSVVVTLQSSHNAPNKSGDDGRDDPVFVFAIERALFIPLPRHVLIPPDRSIDSYVPRAFHARGPPITGSWSA